VRLAYGAKSRRAGYGRTSPTASDELRLGPQLTGRNMRAHFTICAKRPAGSDDVDPRRGTLKVKRGRSAGPRMKSGGLWRAAYGGLDARALHGMSEVAGSLYSMSVFRVQRQPFASISRPLNRT
jgi:hypothetical protein